MTDEKQMRNLEESSEDIQLFGITEPTQEEDREKQPTTI